MMMANASGNAASSARPPITSHVSLPSQIGATESIMASRLASSGANGARMPTPRSKPSRSTYMNTPKASMPAHNGTRSSATFFLLALRRRRQRPRWGRAHAAFPCDGLFDRPDSQEPHHEIGAGAEDRDVRDHINRK